MAQGFIVPETDRIAPQGGLEAVPLPSRPPAPQGNTVQDGYVINPNTATATPITGLPPSAGAQAPGQEALDKEFAKEYAQWRTMGQSDATKGLEQLHSSADALKKKNITGPIVGMTPDWINAWVNPDSIDHREAVEEVAQRNLRLILGGQFAMKEGEQLIARAYNPRLPEPTNRKRVLRLIKQMSEAAEQKESAARYFEENGTLTGWKGKLWSITDFDPEAADSEEAGAPKPAETVPVDFKPSTDGTRSVVDPKKQALGEKIVALMSKGADRNTIMGMAVRADPALRDDPRFRQWVEEALKFRAEHPGRQFPVDPSFYTTEEPLSAGEQNVNEAAQSVPGTFFASGIDAATGGNLPNLVGALGGDEEAARRNLGTMAEINPTANFLGQIGGGGAAVLSGEALLARAGMAPGLLRGLVADGGYGAVAGGSNAAEDEGAAGALKGAAHGIGGGLTGNYLTRGFGNMIKGVSDPAVRTLAEEGTPMSVGQMVSQSGRGGRFVKAAEDKMTSIPVVGDTINARRMEGIQKLNTVAFKKALEPIGETVDGFGETAVAEAQDKVGAAFRKALAGKAATVDAGFISDAGAAKAAIQNLKRVGPEVEDGVDEIVNEYFDPATGAISGENMQTVLQELGKIKRAYSGDPQGYRVGKAVGQLEKAIEGLFRRQAPDVMPAYEAAKKSFQRLSILEDAVLKAANTEGVFTPAQLGLAIRENTKKFGGKHAAAAGRGEMHDLQRAAQKVLPSKVPDSGTAGRLAFPIGAGAVGYAATDGGESTTAQGIGLAGLLALAYSRTGQRVLAGAVKPRGPTAQRVGKAVKNRGRLVGAGAGTQAALGTSRD